MKNCLQCNKELTHVEGRKQKSFCDVNCRNKYFYAQRKVLIEAGRKASEVVETKSTEEKSSAIPKTLEDIKANCPAQLTGFDRSQWISTERQKYNI